MQTITERLERAAVMLKSKGLYLCTAESCTGGLLGHLITNLPGASDFYLGGQITYSNDAKQRWLGVPPETLQRYGAVSEETVLAMATGIRGACAQTTPAEKLIGLSISGIAGPSGGSPQKPVGTVWIGISTPNGAEARHFVFSGDRLTVKEQSTLQAVEMLLVKLSAG